MSKIKLLKASPFYHEYLIRFFEMHPELKGASYHVQYRALMDDVFGWADFWKTNLEETGNFEVCEVVTNAEPLQKRWAEEYNVSYDEKNWIQDILEAQIAEFKPDIFFAHDYSNIPPSFCKKVRGKYNIHTIMGWDGVAQNNPAVYEECDLLLSCNESVVAFYKQHGFRSFFFPFGFETSILKKIREEAFLHEVTFSGSIVLGPNLHNQRIKFLSEVKDKIDVDMYVSGWSPRSFLLPFRVQKLLQISFFEYLKILNMLFKSQKGVFGLEMYQLLHNSRLTLNSHIDSSAQKTGNMRLFEATGTGTCLITDWKENLKDFFEPDTEVVMYRSAEECIEKIKYLVDHEKERKKIALAGQERTLREYSFKNRLREFAVNVLKI